MNDYEKVVQKARDAFNSHKTKPYEFRMTQLQRLKAMLEENQNQFVEALKQDLSKPYMECVIMEVGFMVNDILNTLYNLKDWMKPEKVDKPWYALTDRAYISRDPLGVALILSAWNYPVQLLTSPLVGAIASGKTPMTLLDTSYMLSDPLGLVLILSAWNYPVTLALQPIIGAIAAGNCAVLKPSEISPATAQLLSVLIPRYLDKDCYPVVLGGATETTELLKNKFDHIFYTGSVRVGKIIYEAAAKQFTPVTLELGGKCPTYIDDTVRFDYAAKRIMWGKLINSGQTCVAPDYLMCTKGVEEKFLKNASKYLRDWYGDDPKQSPDLARIVNKTMFDRLVKLLGNGTIAIGGEFDADELYIAPTVLTNVKPTDPIMQEEIFGPILPIITINSVDEAVEFVNSRQKPLSAYVFTSKKSVSNRFLNLTSSGGACVNDCALHLTVETLPFGGIGESGIGNYHGKFSFDCFSHKKAVLARDYFSLGENLAMARYPPYTTSKLNLAKTLLKKRRPIKLGWLKYLLIFLFGAAVAVGIQMSLEHFAS